MKWTRAWKLLWWLKVCLFDDCNGDVFPRLGLASGPVTRIKNTVNVTFAKGLTVYCACIGGSRLIHISVDMAREYPTPAVKLVSKTQRERPVAASILLPTSAPTQHRRLQLNTGSAVFIFPHSHPSSSSALSRVAPFLRPEKISVSSVKYNLTLTLPRSLPHCLYHSSHHHLM